MNPREVSPREWRLTETLALAVPLAMNQVRTLAITDYHGARKMASAWVIAAEDLIAHHGDHILYVGPYRGDTARAFAVLARALAALALQPGGVTFGSLHFEDVLVDPAANLAEQLAISGRLLKTFDAADSGKWMPDPDDTYRLAELVRELHTWVARGGSPPPTWRQPR